MSSSSVRSMGRQPHHSQGPRPSHRQSTPPSLRLHLPFLIGLLLLTGSPARADIRIVSAEGEHRLAAGETRAEAVRLATEQAKSAALEQVATYLESVTVVRNLDVTRDELRSYTAGTVLVLDQRVTTDVDSGATVIRVTLTAQVDTNDVARAITALRENQDARQELLALKKDVDRLRQDLQAANRALATAATPEQNRQLTQRRHDLLDQVQSNALVAQAWNDWVLAAPTSQSFPAGGLAQVHALLLLAAQLHPDNPHLGSARQAVGAKTPPQPPKPPVPHTVPFLPGYNRVPQEPGKEVPSSPNQDRLTSMYQLVPLPDGRSTLPTLHTYQAGSREPETKEP